MKNIYCILGLSGCGKSTIANALAREYGLKVLLSYTTRERRNVHDNDHIYITDEEYATIQDKVATRIRTDGKYCATSQQIDENDIYVIDFDGLDELTQKYKGSKEIKTIYIEVSPETSVNRMQARGDAIEKIMFRIHDDNETNTKENISKCDVVINGESVLAYKDVYKYIESMESVESAM